MEHVQGSMKHSPSAFMWYNKNVSKKMDSSLGKFVPKLSVGDCSRTKRVVGYDNSRPRHKLYDFQCLNCGVIIASAAKAFNTNCKRCGSWGPVGDTASTRTTTRPERQLWNKYKHHAKDRGLNFSITEESFASIIHQDCFYCGAPPSQTVVFKRRYNNTLVYNGIDRFDNDEGYTDSNSVACCWTCNQAKRDYSIKEWIEMVSKWYRGVARWQEKVDRGR